MARAGYCSECQANVWLTEDGGCNAGHPASCISNEYETDPSIASGTAEGSAEIRPRKFGRWVVLGLVALVVLLGCGLAAGALLPRLGQKGAGIAQEWQKRLAKDYPGWTPIGFSVNSFRGTNGSQTTTYMFNMVPPGSQYSYPIVYVAKSGASAVSEDEILRPAGRFHDRANSLMDYVNRNYYAQNKSTTAITSDADGNAIVEWVRIRQFGPFSSRVGSSDHLTYDASSGTWSASQNSTSIMTPYWSARVAKDYPGWRVLGFRTVKTDIDSAPETVYWVAMVAPGTQHVLRTYYVSSHGGLAISQDEVFRSDGTFHFWAPQLMSYLDDHYFKRGRNVASVTSDSDGFAYVTWTRSGAAASSDKVDALQLDTGSGRWSLSP